jgi:hypothetical protein
MLRKGQPPPQTSTNSGLAAALAAARSPHRPQRVRRPSWAQDAEV